MNLTIAQALESIEGSNVLNVCADISVDDPSRVLGLKLEFDNDSEITIEAEDNHLVIKAVCRLEVKSW